MRQLHIRAQSGPRPVTVAAVRALLADGQLDPTDPVLSLDGGRTWQSAASALAVVDGQAVEDGAVDRALRTGPLHPVAMPLGGLGVALLVAGIAFSGSPAAPAIRDAPLVAAGVAIRTAGAVVSCVGATAEAGVGSVVGFVGGLVSTSPAPVAVAPIPDAPAKVAAEKPITANGDLLADWRKLASDTESPEAEWTAASDVLGKRTVADGLAGWNVRLTLIEKLTEQNRASMTRGLPGANSAVRVAVFELNSITLQLLVQDQALAETCDKMVADGRDPRISAQITSVAANAAGRSVVLNGTLTAAE